MKSHYILKTWMGMDFIFPHWTLYWLFWFSLVMIPVPISFAHHSGPISYKTGYALSVYLMCIFTLLYMLAAFIGYKYTHTQGGGVKNYEHRRNKIVAVALPIGAATLYFTGYLVTIPFGHAPNYVFTLKPSPQLEMELNHLLGDDTIEYTPFDYSLDEQEVTYVTNGVDSMILNMIERPKRSPETIVTLSERDLEYVTSIRTLTPFKFEIVEKTCYLSANTYDFKPHTIGHPHFKTPIRIKLGEKGSMNVSVEGVFEVKHGSCNEVPGYSQEYDPVKEIALEAYFRYPYTYSDIFKYRVEKRPTFTMTIARFDWFISNF